MRCAQVLNSLKKKAFRLLPGGRGSELVREKAGTVCETYRLNHRLREQVRSHGLRPESKTNV
ncbi:hypothetical protein B0A91_18565 [Pseudomonas syringae]|nr:hypothetical protein B1F67_10360 [Pseudomonas syringae]RXU06888.1 hypothetical protein B1F70_24635 [Pseudomonas syringae]RXU11781.1 hypothetical protein B1F68_00495 [Pseudomonas syringae]RXU14486.1 hypothetical protein BXU05_09635 [Pseudomonas syringae]RXU19467.1 hypothetical protein B0A91_18565 [Pseudomonas syringae]